MNQLDLVIVIIAVLAALGGWRLGFISKVSGWAGLAVGSLAASRIVPHIVTPSASPNPTDLVRTLGVVMVGATVGQIVGQLVGRRLRPTASGGGLHRLDQTAGVSVAVAAVVIMTWMVLPAMSQVDGWPSTLARGSKVGGATLRILGEPPNILQGVSQSLGVADLPSALSGLGGIAEVPAAPTASPVPAPVLENVRRSVVKLSGPACGRIQSGSGFVVANGVVATNAHVVAGTESLVVSTDDGQEFDAAVEYFDPDQDIAFVRVDRFDRVPLPLVTAATGDKGAVIGYPGGGPLVVQPYEVAGLSQANSRDIYDTREVRRSVLTVGSRIGPGDSGGPLIDPVGRVAGMAFGVSPTDPETAYAIPTSELPAPSAVMLSGPVSTSRCRS